MSEEHQEQPKRKPGRPRVSAEHHKETTRKRNVRNYAKMKEAREFYKKFQNELCQKIKK